jgi:hypothetical protein
MRVASRSSLNRTMSGEVPGRGASQEGSVTARHARIAACQSFVLDSPSHVG